MRVVKKSRFESEKGVFWRLHKNRREVDEKWRAWTRRGRGRFGKSAVVFGSVGRKSPKFGKKGVEISQRAVGGGVVVGMTFFIRCKAFNLLYINLGHSLLGMKEVYLC